jgi:pilus assembly protein CpaC
VLGKGIGTTNILLWDKSNRLNKSFDVEVVPDLNSLKEKIHLLLPDEAIDVHTSQGAIVLTGEVSSLIVMDTAVRLAHSFLQAPSTEGATQQGEVINLLSVGGAQQVVLKVTVAEMDREVSRRMNINFLSLYNSPRWNVGALNRGAPTIFDPVTGELSGIGLGSGTGLGITGSGLFAAFDDGTSLFGIAFDASKENGSTKVLAEPTLTTLSGQEAEFLAGGEFPIPVPQEDGVTTVEFKEFGIALKFLPVVLNSGKINLKLHVEVTEISDLTFISNFAIPTLTTRRAFSTVELGDGQTIGIAGLLRETMSDNVEKFPFLGDIPILGQLFRSSSFEKKETELVILVTPTLARPLPDGEYSLPGDDFLEPNDMAFYLLGRTHSSPVSQTSAADNQIASADTAAVAETTEVQSAEIEATLPATGGSESQFGHSVNQ